MWSPDAVRWRLVRLLCTLLLAGLGSTALAQAVAGEPRNQTIPLAGIAQAWIDDNGSRTAAGVLQDSTIPWNTLQTGAIHRLRTGKVLWVRFTAPAEAGEGWFLQIQYPSVNLATLYLADASGVHDAGSAGDSLPVADWPVPHRFPLLPLSLRPDAARRYLVRIENPHSFSASLELVHLQHAGPAEQRSSFLLGVYFGLAGLAAAVALLSSVVLRDGTYGRYFLAIVAMAMAQAAATGVGGLMLWPRSPWWNDVSSLLLPVLAGAAFLWFFASAVSLSQRYLRLHRGLLVLAGAGPVVALAVALVEPSMRFRLQVPYVACACIAGASILFWAGRRGDRHARWMLWALLPVASSALLPLAGTWGLIPVSALTLNAMPLAIAFELPALLVILMLRSQERREHGRRLLGLYRIDPATGLPNTQVFRKRLAVAIERAERMKYRSVVLLVEVAHPQEAGRDFDERGPSTLALHLAGRLLSVAREVDTVARLGDHRFGLLFEGPLSAKEAAGAGQRVVARCLMPLPNRPLAQTIQVRVAQAVVPHDGTDPQQVLARLHARLAGARPDGRRAIHVLGAEAAA